MMRFTLCLALVLGLTTRTATASDVQLSWSARLFDGVGQPLAGAIEAEVRLYDSPDGGSLLCS